MDEDPYRDMLEQYRMEQRWQDEQDNAGHDDGDNT